MSDNELDAELLALAGDDSSDGEEQADIHSVRDSRSPSAQPTKTVEKTRSPPARGVSQKVKSRGARAAARKRRKDESEEEGEASTPSSAKSLGSAAMSESDSETSPGDLDDDAPLYPIEGKFRSESDRADVLGMTEIQREEILAERAAEVERRAQDQQLKRILQQRRREEAAGADRRKRKAAAADLEEDARKSSRPKVKASAPLEAYKKERELKGAQKARGAGRAREDRSPSREHVDSDADAEADSEVEWDDKPRVSAASKEEAPAELRDLERCRVGRTNFAMVCFYPTFESSIKGCLCRVSIGVNRETGEPQYRIAQIKGFTEGKPYPMEGPNGKQFYTDQYAIVAHGKAEKEWPFVACSDSKFTESEFDRYKRALTTDSLRAPSRKFLEMKLNDIHTLISRQWTDQEIQVKVNRIRAMHDKFQSHGREKIAKRREEAAARGDDAAVAKLDQELAAMGVGTGTKPVSSSANVSKDKSNKAIMQQERLAALNKANRKANSEDIRKAQLAEKRVQQKAREEAIAKARQRDADAAEAAKNKMLNVPGDDLFGDASDISRTGTPLNGAGTPKRIGTPSGAKKQLGGFKKKPMDEDVIAAMDLGIDIEI